MELKILYLIQSIHCAGLDALMVKVFNDFVGSKGEIWVILGILFFLFPRTRKTGLCVLSAYILAYFLGDAILKDWIARPRPCMIDESVELIIKRPTSYSCPSVHSMLAFASASVIFWNYRKAGIIAIVFAALIGFSRMYFFVHYPTDVLFGTILGFAIGSAVYYLFKRVDSKK